MSWYNNFITEFDSQDFIECLEFCKIICKNCEHYKHGRCEYYQVIRPDVTDNEAVELYPRDYMCRYNDLYLQIEEAAANLEGIIWNIARQPACNALNQLHHSQELDELFNHLLA